MAEAAWRLLTTDPADGATNMAVDQAIMEAVAARAAPPTLRFYTWSPACLSLGYTQPISDVDQARLVTYGWHLVRRLTGGRAILHTDELTYSVCVPDDHPLVAGDIVESYRHLSRALLAGLQQLGAAPEAGKRAHGERTAANPVCFEVPSHYEITVDGKKLVGSAQVRKYGAVLQHGSLPLWGDIGRICNVLAFEDESRRLSARARLQERAATLESVLNQPPTWEHVAHVMAQSFRDTFGLEFTAEALLTPAEHARGEDLRTTRYSSEAWNGRF
jgi:lipoyl(octanoyl) transferase